MIHSLLMVESANRVIDLRKKSKKEGQRLDETFEESEFYPGNDTALISWEAPEYVKNEKAGEWIFGLALVAIGLLFWAIYSLNILFAAFVMTAFLAVLIMSRRNPRVFTFRINRKGIWIGDRFHPFHSLDSFWIFTFPEKSILSLKPKSYFAGNTHILLEGISHEEVRDILSQYLPEEEQHYSLLDWLSDQLHI